MSYRLGQRDLVTGVWKLEGSGKMPDNLASCFTEKIAHHERVPSLLPIFFFFLPSGCAAQPVGSQFLDQGLNPGHGSESPES